jgi:hypothetical protein
VGISIFMGGESTPSRAVVQSSGSPPVVHLLLRYTQASFSQAAQTAACNKHHSLEGVVAGAKSLQKDGLIRMRGRLLPRRRAA